MVTSTSNTTRADVQLDGDPQLILGRRQGRRAIEAVVIELHADLFPALRDVCERFKNSLEVTSPRRYEPHAAVEADSEHFVLELEELPEQPEPARTQRRQPDDNEENADRTAALVKALRSPSALPTISVQQLRNFNALFYSIAFQQEGGSWTNFIRKSDPRQLLKPGLMWTHYGAALRKVETPDMVLEREIDVILTHDRLAGFNGNAIKNLFTDVHLAARDANVYVDGVVLALGADMPIADESLEILRAAARQKVSLARRLYLLQEKLASLDIKPDRVREVLTRHNFDHSIYLNERDEFSFTADNVRRFIDLLEGRYFESDWDSEPRRADRFSTRP
jgi:hypothetical protein